MPTLPHAPSATILVVEDDQMVLQLVVKVLKIAQFHVLSAENAEQALELAANLDTPIDLLLSDVNMPGMNGPDLGEALKKARPDLRVVLMSGMAAGGLLVLNHGWAFLTKPFVPTELVRMVRDVLGRPEQSQGGQGFDTRKNIDHQ